MARSLGLVLVALIVPISPLPDVSWSHFSDTASYFEGITTVRRLLIAVPAIAMAYSRAFNRHPELHPLAPAFASGQGEEAALAWLELKGANAGNVSAQVEVLPSAEAYRVAGVLQALGRPLEALEALNKSLGVPSR